MPRSKSTTPSDQEPSTLPSPHHANHLLPKRFELRKGKTENGLTEATYVDNGTKQQIIISEYDCVNLDQSNALKIVIYEEGSASIPDYQAEKLTETIVTTQNQVEETLTEI